MPYTNCPVCSTRLYLVQTTVHITRRQRAILDAIPHVCRETQRTTARTVDIAAHVGWSERTVLYELQYLEQAGEVVRPNGKRSGWAIAEQPVVRVAEREQAV